MAFACFDEAFPKFCNDKLTNNDVENLDLSNNRRSNL